jgi:hypothetical protein
VKAILGGDSPSAKSAYEAFEKLAHTAEEVKHLDVSFEFYQ